jgi:hypothetical protein
MAIYKYLGYGVTNSKGKAKLDHDKNGDPITHSYTGTGAGELDIIASLDNPSTISDSSIQSEIYSLLDNIAYDDGIGGNTNYHINNPNLVRTVENDGALLTNNGTGTYYWCILPPNTTVTTLTETKVFTGDVIIEADILSCDSDTSIQINADSTLSRKLTTFGETPLTVKMKVVNNTVYRWNGTSWTEMGDITTSYGIRFGVSAGTSLKYRNFKVYSI